MFYPAQSERYFCSVPLNTAVSFETKQNKSIFDPIPSQEGLLFVLVWWASPNENLAQLCAIT